MRHRPVLALALLLVTMGGSPSARPQGAAAADRPITLAVDASAAPRKILSARLSIPVGPGPLTLVYPKWIPGEHGPTGPVVDLAGLRLSAAGQPVAWSRDPLDMHAFRLSVPESSDTLEAAIEFVLPAGGEGFTSGASSTANLLVLNWNQLVLYPQGRPAGDIRVSPSLRLPAGWKYGTALVPSRESRDRIAFEPVTLARLVDSPLIAGAYFRRVPLSDGAGPAHVIDMAADSLAALAAPAERIEAYRRLVAETVLLFGARHYERYHFLLALSDHVAHFGLEHHESSDNRVRERFLVDPDRHLLSADLLPHEMVHSWNGKYRRPVGLATPDFQQPMDSTMLWIYEGLTQYLGEVLAARSGLRSPEQFREALAFATAELDHRPGRAWRPLVDTAKSAQILFGAADAWKSRRRGVDFYDEGTLIWLEADTLIRRETGGRRSLDDFCRRFHGGTSGPPAVVPYGMDDVVNALAEVLPFDWKGFFDRRLNALEPRAPLQGLEAAGWKLAYTGDKPERQRAREQVEEITDARFSLGITLGKDGVLQDVIAGSPAALAGLGPGMRLVAVRGRAWSRTVLEDALRGDVNATTPLELLVESGEFFRAHRVDYRGGERYPRLERIAARDDLLGEIIRPATAAAAR